MRQVILGVITSEKIMNILEKIKDLLNMGATPLLGILIFSGFFLFIPDQYLEKLKVVEIKNEYEMYFGLSFLFAFAFLLSLMYMNYLKPIFKTKINLFFYKKDAKHLTSDEKEIMRGFINQKTRAAQLSIQNATVLSLESRKIIVRVGNIGIPGFEMKFPFNIQPWAWDFYNNNPKLLE